jgi:hypothetical protein
MKSHSNDSRSIGLPDTRVQAAALVLILATGFACFSSAAHAQNSDQAALEDQFAQESTCSLYGCGNGNGNGTSTNSAPRVDPCSLRRNAMIPCDTPPSKPPEVEPGVVGTWEIAMPGGPWVLEVHGDGTYAFHSEAGDGAAPHAGRFSASNGRWWLPVLMPPPRLLQFLPRERDRRCSAEAARAMTRSRKWRSDTWTRSGYCGPH